MSKNKNVAVAVKTKSKLKNCLLSKEIDKIVSFDKVSYVINYFKNREGYKKTLSYIDENIIHRGKVEIIIRNTLYDELKTLKNFVSYDIKKILKILILKDEIETVKIHLRMILGSNPVLKENYEYRKNKFKNLKFLSEEPKNIEDFINSTKGTFYYDILSPLSVDKTRNIFCVETALDLYYTKLLTTQIKKVKQKEEKETLKKVFGIEIDILNIMFILRSKFYYNLKNEEIYPFVFHYYYKLNTKIISKLVDSSSLNEVFKILNMTIYKKIKKCDDLIELEREFKDYFYKIIVKMFRKEPKNETIPIVYAKIKTFEINNVLALIESIRYKTSLSETFDRLKILK